MAYLLDTGIAIDLRDRRAPIVDAFGQLPVLPFMSVVSLVELHGGVFLDPQSTGERQKGLAQLLDMLTLIDLTTAIANRYGHIVERHGFSRRKIIDRMIAATALEHGLILITGSGSDFAEIDGLTLQNWSA